MSIADQDSAARRRKKGGCPRPQWAGLCLEPKEFSESAGTETAGDETPVENGRCRPGIGPQASKAARQSPRAKSTTSVTKL